MRFLAIGVVGMLIVAIPLFFWMKGTAANHALRTATFLSERLVDSTLDQWDDAAMTAQDPAALDRLDGRVNIAMAEGSVVRVKVWNSDGRILYSDVRSLVGESPGLPAAAQTALDSGESRTSIELHDEQDSDVLTGAAQVLEVYVSSSTGQGQLLVFEIYFDGSVVAEEEAAIFFDIIPAVALALIVLQLAQLVPAVGLARRLYTLNATRRELVEQAALSSESERQRVARILHDDVIQDLAGLAYALDAEGRSAEPGRQPVLNRAWRVLQVNIQRLRLTTDELYPPDMRSASIVDALGKLSERFSRPDFTVSIEAEPDMKVETAQATLLYRVAREVLQNAARHSRASRIDVELLRVGGRVEMRIEDDGIGFDQSAPVAGAHFGLRIVRDTVAAAGGTVQISSQIGAGTSLVVRLPLMRETGVTQSVR